MTEAGGRPGGGRSIWRILLTLLGLALFAYLIWRVGPGQVVENIRQLGWGLGAIIALTAVSHVVKAGAWHFAISPRHRSSFSLFQKLQMRLAGEAVTQVTFAGHVFGETAKALMLKTRMPLEHGVSSVVLDRGMYAFTALGMLVLGGALAPLISPLELQRGYVAVMAGVLLVMGVMAAALRRRWPFLSAPFGRLLGWGLLPERLADRRQKLCELETLLQDFYHLRRADFRRCLGLNLVGQVVAMVEVFLVLWFLGLEPGLVTVFLIEAFTKLVNLAGAVIPANLGAYEGGNVVILQAFGFTAGTGLTLGLARRIRGLFWTAVGLLLLLRFRAGADE